MRTVLIYHEDDIIDRDVTAGWLASFSDLAGLVILREKPGRMKTRIKREMKRVGPLRFLDVLAFRLYYKFVLADSDEEWKNITATKYRKKYGEIGDVPRIIAASPNSNDVKAFLEKAQPDIIVARCKTILKKEIFSIAKTGTFVFHPGICPEYRNAHGCFWALAEGELDKVGLTLLKIDEGVDTGPVFGYFTYEYDAGKESHIRIQNRVFTENLNEIEKKLEEINAGAAVALDTEGRTSKTWGQPWLSKYLEIKRKAGQDVKNKATGLKV